MDAWRDVVDWVGGYPFEVAKPEEVFDFYLGRGFILQRLKTCAGGHGCNEYVLMKSNKRIGSFSRDSKRAGGEAVAAARFRDVACALDEQRRRSSRSEGNAEGGSSEP